jgi:hypothetical protein
MVPETLAEDRLPVLSADVTWSTPKLTAVDASRLDSDAEHRRRTAIRATVA